MQFLYPLGALSFLSLGVVLALYLLKRRSRQARVSSLLLWQKTLRETTASHPFEKLRKQLLLFLQLLLCALLAFSLMQPTLAGKAATDCVLVFDLSASMQAKTDGKSRLDLSLGDARALIGDLPQNTRVSILLAGREVTAPIVASSDQAQLLRALSTVTAQNGAGTLSQAVSLAKAMAQESEGADIIVYSDAFSSAEDVSVRSLGRGEDNAALDALTLTPVENGVAAYLSATNYGSQTTLTIELYANGALYDVRELSLAQNGTAGAQVLLPENTTAARAVITKNGGALSIDDERFAILNTQVKKRVLLVSAGNVFVEKAVQLRGDVELYKTSKEDYAADAKTDLYIFDGFLPDELPKTGAIFALNIEKPLYLIAPQAAKNGASTLRMAALPTQENLTNALTLGEFSLSAYRPLLGGEAVLSVQGDPVLSVLTTDAQRCAVLSFDVHNSNLPLKSDFPVLIQNLLRYLLPDTVLTEGGMVCGETVSIHSTALEKIIQTPLERTVQVPGTTFDDTNEQGVYTLRLVKTDGTAMETSFALHMDKAESDVRVVSPSHESELSKAVKAGAGRSLTPLLLALFLALLMIEWGVSRRGA